jgi:hypothetical protein
VAGLVGEEVGHADKDRADLLLRVHVAHHLGDAVRPARRHPQLDVLGHRGEEPAQLAGEGRQGVLRPAHKGVVALPLDREVAQQLLVGVLAVAEGRERRLAAVRLEELDDLLRPRRQPNVGEAVGEEDDAGAHAGREPLAGHREPAQHPAEEVGPVERPEPPNAGLEPVLPLLRHLHGRGDRLHERGEGDEAAEVARGEVVHELHDGLPGVVELLPLHRAGDVDDRDDADGRPLAPGLEARRGEGDGQVQVLLLVVADLLEGEAGGGFHASMMEGGRTWAGRSARMGRVSRA